MQRPQSVSPILYELDLREPSSHLVHVTMTVPEAAPETEIQFPAWNALYEFRDFIRNVQALHAECSGRRLELESRAQAPEAELNTWRSGPEPCPKLVLHYDVYLNGEPPFGSVLDQKHGFFNFAMLLFYVSRERHRPARVRFALPAGWKIATLLDETEMPGEYQASDYDALADDPAEAGTFQEYSYTQNGATFRVIVHADPADYSRERLLGSLRTITAAETALMRDVPFTRYTFIFHFLRAPTGGGMEHKYGTAINVRAPLGRDMGAFEAVAAHEFFHAWNVKRIRPQALEPVDYVHGNDTSELWFSEGVTSTYGELTLLRAGLETRQLFYSKLAEKIRSLESRPARNFQSAEEAGREAWLEKYPDYLRAERSISYYDKGELLGYLLDLGIRHDTRNHCGLDDLMRELNEQFARRHRFFTPAHLEAVITQLAPAFARARFFRDYVRGTVPLPYGTYLGYAGLQISSTRQQAPDAGFVALEGFEGPPVVEFVESGSGADQAGLQPGDIVLKLNGRALEGLPQEQLETAKPGSEIKLSIRRGRETFDLKFRLGRGERTLFRVDENPNASPEELAVRDGWLSGRTDK